MDTGRFFLSTDNDSHWYVIPVECREDWEAFCDLDPDSEAAWTSPDWAVAVGGPPDLVTFERPVF